jgi:aspartyl protease family protein
VRRLGFVTAVIALLLLLLLLAQRNGAFEGLGDEDFWLLVSRIIMLVFVGAFVLMTFRERFARVAASLAVWLLIGLGVAVGYTYRFDLRDVGERLLGEFLPGYAATRGRVVEVARANGGGFSVSAQINGAPVSLILDTGASSVVLTQDAAKAAGLPLEVLSYTVNVETANGRARAAPVTLDRLAVGGIVERSVPALIAQPGQLRTSLLGMSFLNRLESWEVRGDRLVLRAYP